MIATVDRVAARVDADTLEKCMQLIRMLPVWNGYSGTVPLSNASGLVWMNKTDK